jgi:hypothetical protein
VELEIEKMGEIDFWEIQNHFRLRNLDAFIGAFLDHLVEEVPEILIVNEGQVGLFVLMFSMMLKVFIPVNG